MPDAPKPRPRVIREEDIPGPSIILIGGEDPVGRAKFYGKRLK